jgi:hypothetical protein
MRYVILLLFAFLFCKICHSQEKELAKYSYLLVGIRNEDTIKKNFTYYPLGTCFFIRSSNGLHLITAKHCINGYNVFNLQKTDSQFDTIGFRYYNTKTKQFAIASLYIKSLKKYFPNNYFFESPDLAMLTYSDPPVEPFIYSIENYVFSRGGNRVKHFRFIQLFVR